MPAVSITISRNDCDVIEEMIRHNSQFLDMMYIADMSSSDGTLEIIEALFREGLPVKIFAKNFFTEAAHRIINQAVTDLGIPTDYYILTLDSDEFIKCDKHAFDSFINSCPESFCSQWTTYVPTIHDDQSCLKTIDRITHRRLKDPKRPTNWKVALSPKDRKIVTLTKGNHGFVEKSVNRQSEIRLAHYPVRSPEQIATKVLIGSWSLSLLGIDKGEAFQWFNIADHIKKNGIPSLHELQDFAQRYSANRTFEIHQDKLNSPSFFNIKYQSLQQKSTLHSLIEYTDKLVHSILSTTNN